MHFLLDQTRPIITQACGAYVKAIDPCWYRVGSKRVLRFFFNQAFVHDVQPSQSAVTIDGSPVVTMQDCIPHSYGNELSEGGLYSHTKGGKAVFVSASSVHTINGYRIIRHGDLMVCNNGNTRPSPILHPSGPPL